jgi:hypothetical protein
MPQVVIENPVLNSPYKESTRHFKFSDEGITQAEIDEPAWATLYSTVSRPFDPPKTGKIAIKVINHYGDEVLKVYEVKESTVMRCKQPVW